MYYENNVSNGIALIGALVQAGVRRFVFSSTCATYGEPQQVPIGVLISVRFAPQMREGPFEYAYRELAGLIPSDSRCLEIGDDKCAESPTLMKDVARYSARRVCNRLKSKTISMRSLWNHTCH